MSETSTVGGVDARADVELRLPADGAFASVLRTLTAGLAARLDFTIDDIEDLRIAVGEACAMVLTSADPGSDLTCSFYTDPTELTIVVSAPNTDETGPNESGFAWQVLSALTTNADSSRDDGNFAVTLTMHSTADI